MNRSQLDRKNAIEDGTLSSEVAHRSAAKLRVKL
jgi:hypothetical protein